MADRARQFAELLSLIPEGHPGNATIQFLRDLVTSIPNVAGAVVNVMDPRFAGGAKGDGVSLDDAAFAAAITAAQAANAKLYLPPGTFQLSSPMPWPAGLDIEGAGKDRTTVRVSGAVNGIDAADAGPGYAMSGTLRKFTLQGAGGALKGINLNFRNMPHIEAVRVSGFAQQGIYFNNCLLGFLGHQSYVINCGGATFAQVEVENSTTFLWDHAYISGTGVTTVAGLAIDKSSSTTIVGGAIESTGIPIRLGAKADAVTGVKGVSILGINLENPNNGATCYIEMGAGWSGAANQGVTNVQGFYNASPSGSTTVAFSVKAQNTDTVYFAQCRTGLPTFANGGIANFELAGTTNIRWSLGPMSSALGVSLMHVRENGAQRPDALPFFHWMQSGGNIPVLARVTLALNSATPDTGGYCFVGTNSAIATTILNLTGGFDRQLLYIYAGDVNTTLKHNNAGTGKFSLIAGVDKLLAVGSVTPFLWDPNVPGWRQVG